jgi:hypothetical protein
MIIVGHLKTRAQFGRPNGAFRAQRLEQSRHM